MLRKLFFAMLGLSLITISCTKLKEDLNGQLTESQIGGGGSAGGNAGALLNGVYNNIRGTFQDQAGVYALWEMTTDELIGPTRGGDWDDNGAWRVLHSHKFDADHIRVTEVFAALGGVMYGTTDLLRFNPTTQQKAEARMLRAFAEFMMLDGWGQVPYREVGESVLNAPKVRKGVEE